MILPIIQSIIQGINECSFENKKGQFDKLLGAIHLENEKFLNADPWAISDSLFQKLILRNSPFDKKTWLSRENIKFPRVFRIFPRFFCERQI